MEEETYTVGICPLCGLKRMVLNIERERHHTYAKYECTNCHCETHRQKLPLSVFGTNNTVPLSVSYLMHHWKSLEAYFLHRREYTTQKVLIHSQVSVNKAYLKVCPICRSPEIIHVQDYKEGSECLLCKQCNFHSGYRSLLEDKVTHSKLYTNWNNT